MVFGSLFKPKGELALQAPDSSMPGDIIPIGILLIPEEDVKPREVRAELVGEETYYKTETHTNSRGHPTTHTVQKNEAFTTIVQTLAEQPILVKGLEQKWNCSLQLPSDVPGTCRGKLVNIRWTLKAVLDVPKRADLSQEKPLLVFSPYRQTAGITDFAAEKTFGEVALELKAPPAAQAGDIILGKLTLQIKEKLGLRGIRVELVQIEEAGTRRADNVISTAQVSGEASFSQHESPSFEFSLEVPAEAPPSAICKHSSLLWKVRAVIDRKMKTDFSVEQELFVYNSLTA